MSSEQRTRNRKIFADKLKGATYRELSIKYMLTLDRVFKIVRREKLRDLGLLPKRKKRKSKKNG